MPKPLKLRELLQRLRRYGIISRKGRGKGSELMLLLPEKEGSKRGLMYPIKNHGMGTEINKHVIQAILRRFTIDEKDFWGEKTD